MRWLIIKYTIIGRAPEEKVKGGGGKGGDASPPEDSSSRVSCRIRPLAHLILNFFFSRHGTLTGRTRTVHTVEGEGITWRDTWAHTLYIGVMVQHLRNDLRIGTGGKKEWFGERRIIADAAAMHHGRRRRKAKLVVLKAQRGDEGTHQGGTRA